MRVLRGRAADVESDRERTGELLDRVAETGEPAVRVWRPHRQVAFGRRDAGAEGYERARDAATEEGFEPTERSVGGRAVAYTGSTVAFARAVPIDDLREGLDRRYARATTDLQVALGRLGVHASPGEPADSFCPGSHSLQADEGKVVGIAQRVRRGAALVAGVVLVRDHEAIADVLGPVYEALGEPFDPDTVGSVARAGGDADPGTVVETVERALVREADEADLAVEELGG